MSQGEWYYCLKHHAVEPYDGCKSEDRLGPYPTQGDAARALERVKERNEQWDAEDEQDDPDAPPGFRHADSDFDPFRP